MPITLNRSLYAAPMYLVDAAGEAGSITIQLATNATLAAGASTTPMTVSKTSSYGWNYILSGTSPSLKLQSLGADGTTWVDIATVTASGAQRIDIFAGSTGAQVRLFNAGANPITALSSTLAN